jgi:hypothetical protein
MRVSPRELRAVRAGGLIARYAILREAVFVIADLPETGSSGTSLEEPCRVEHWGIVLQGELSLEGRSRRTYGPGTAFYVRPGPPDHRFRATERVVVAGFAPVTEPIDESPAALRARGVEVVGRVPAPPAPPPTVKVSGVRTSWATVGQVETESAEMGDWLFTKTSFGPLSGYTDGWCDLPHWGLVLDGDLVLRWEDGALELLGPGDAYHTPAGPPGHRLEVADVASVVDYTPISAVEEGGRRQAPRTATAWAARHRTRARRAVSSGPSLTTHEHVRNVGLEPNPV